MRVRVSKSGCIASGIDLHAKSFIDQKTDDLIQPVTVFFVRIELIFAWTVADDIINMAVDIKAGHGMQIFNDRFKIRNIRLFFGASLKKSRIVGILSVYHMG